MTMNTPPCQVCGRNNIKPYFNKHGYPYQICKNCGLVRIFPQLTDEELESIYHQGYYEHWGGDEEVFRLMKIKTFAHFLDHFIRPKITTDGARLLDVGAATGILMETARERGYDVYGMEAAQDGAALIAQKFGRDHVVNGYFGKGDDWPAEFFDVICMSDLFEHVRDPQTVLRKAHTLLRSGGFLLMSLPDTGSLSRKILRRQWSHFIPEHLFSYSRDNIKQILIKEHFSIRHIGSARKDLTIEYAGNVWHSMGGGVVDRLASFLCRLVPRWLAVRPFPLYVGQMVVLSQKEPME